MRLLTWNELNIGSILFIGLVSGYVMAILGMWTGRIPGLVSIDIADFGRRYIVSDRSGAWYFGMISHLANSVIFVLFWAMAIVPNCHIPLFMSAILWGLFLALTLSGGFVAPMSGMGIMGHKTGNHRFALTNILLHLVWGAFTGTLYSPP